MSMTVSQTQLKGATKDLMLRWSETTDAWNDPVSRAFEKEFLSLLEPKVRSALSAMDRMNEMIARARRDCE